MKVSKPFLTPGRSLLLSNLLLIAGLVALRLVSPEGPIDPWGLFSPKKISQMILAIAIVQLLGIYLKSWIGLHAGNLLTGFLGGLISSTATTLTLAKQNRENPQSELGPTLLVFYATTLAMLFEAAVILVAGGAADHLPLFVVFAAPILLSIVQILRIFRRSRETVLTGSPTEKLSLSSILKLAAFIVAILALSKLGQHLLGNSGLVVLTFLISLFEIHASIISNVQLHAQGTIDTKWLAGLMTASIFASYLSKLFLVTTLGTAPLARAVRRWTLLMGFVLAAGLALSVWLTSMIG